MDNNWFNFKKNLERNYRVTFNGTSDTTHEAGKEVIADLKTFCNGTKSNFSNDPLQMARAEGRREVFLHILDYLKLDYTQEVYELENEYEV